MKYYPRHAITSKEHRNKGKGDFALFFIIFRKVGYFSTKSIISNICSVKQTGIEMSKFLFFDTSCSIIIINKPSDYISGALQMVNLCSKYR